ncbi:MAG: hypothetical protein QF565_16380 [Arenicellales bacterium]|jgi:hypothetical protein|nr:hypothetical protein [Arenicellales bacterium]
MTARQPVYATMLVFAACFLAACGSESTGGVYNQAFNVSGHWSGTIYGKCFSGGRDPVSMTLSDGGGDVSGTMTTGGHSSISSGTLTGTAVQAPENTTGDNPLTADQENSNQGSLVLSMTADETVTTTTTTAGAGGVESVSVDNAGSGYTSAPIVEFLSTGHGGEGVEGIAVIDAAGTVVGVVVTDPGSGYVTAPGVMFSGGGGSGATATATIIDADEEEEEETTTYTVTFTLAGTSSKLSGHYSGIWGCCGLAVCGSNNARGEICLSRAGLCPPP